MISSVNKSVTTMLVDLPRGDYDRDVSRKKHVRPERLYAFNRFTTTVLPALFRNIKAASPNKWDERRLQVPVFNAPFYLVKYPDLMKAFGPAGYAAAMVHWERHGINEGRQASFSFNLGYYFNANRKRIEREIRQRYGAVNNRTIVQHYIEVGIDRGYAATPYFDANHYLRVHRDVRKHKGFGTPRGALMHWLNHGIKEGRATAPGVNIRDIVRRGHPNLKILCRDGDYSFVWLLYMTGKINSPKLRDANYVRKVYKLFKNRNKRNKTGITLHFSIVSMVKWGVEFIKHAAKTYGIAEYVRNHSEPIRKAWKELKEYRSPSGGGGGGGGGGGSGGRCGPRDSCPQL